MTVENTFFARTARLTLIIWDLGATHRVVEGRNLFSNSPRIMVQCTIPKDKVVGPSFFREQEPDGRNLPKYADSLFLPSPDGSAGVSCQKYEKSKGYRTIASKCPRKITVVGLTKVWYNNRIFMSQVLCL